MHFQLSIYFFHVTTSYTSVFVQHTTQIQLGIFLTTNLKRRKGYVALLQDHHIQAMLSFRSSKRNYLAKLLI